MKLKEKEESRKLRKEGYSINGIAKRVGVSKGSVSTWVRDIELTDEQIKVLDERMIENRFGKKGVGYKKLLSIQKSQSKKYREKRKKYQEEGRKLVHTIKNKDFMLGCMLYWAEGTKKRDVVGFSNTDIDMMVFFIKFIRTYFNIDENRLSYNLQYYTNNGLSQKDVELFWQMKLNLLDKQKRKHYIDYRPIKNLGRKIGKCPYGVCRITYNNVIVVQKIFGAIKELIGINNDKWID